MKPSPKLCSEHAKSDSSRYPDPDVLPYSLTSVSYVPLLFPFHNFFPYLTIIKHYQSYAAFFCLDNSCLSPSPPAPYHMRNHPYPIFGTSLVNRLHSTHVYSPKISDYGHAWSRLSGDTLTILFPLRNPTIMALLPLRPPSRLITSLHTDESTLKNPIVT